jgi:hypothetical protein
LSESDEERKEREREREREREMEGERTNKKRIFPFLSSLLSSLFSHIHL